MTNGVLAVCAMSAVLVCLAIPPIAAQDVLFRMDSNKPDLSKFTLTLPEKWTAIDDGIIYRSDDWGWGSATVNPGVDDYRLDADVSVGAKLAKDSDLVNPADYKHYNGPGIVFRKSGNRAALFSLAQPCGGWAALVRFLPFGDAKFPGKDSVFALTKDTEKGNHHLTVLVKGDLANCFVDSELACILDLSGYQKGEVGLSGYFGAKFISFSVSKLPRDAKLVTTRAVRKLLPERKLYKSKYEWQESVTNAIKVVDAAIADGTADVPGQEHMPAYTYRCVVWMKPGMKPFYAYPAFHHSVAMVSLANAYSYTKDRKYLKEALRLADWMMEFSTPASNKLPNLPYSTTYNGKMGGNVDGDSVMLDKVGLTASVYIKLWQLTGDQRLKDGAVKIAETLLGCQLADGRWQARVEHATGIVKQDYISNQIFNIKMMDDLYEITKDKRYAESSKRAFDWVMNNPVKTWRWTGYYEDVQAGEESIGNWDAIDTARYLLAHREERPEYLKTAKDIVDWVATSFAVKETGKWPLVCEQSVCMPAMVGHTMHYALLLSDMFKATNDKYYRDAAISASRAAFDVSREGGGASDWYSCAMIPLYYGLDLVNALGL